MSDFTVTVFNPVGGNIVPTNVKIVGNQLKVLANELENLPEGSATVHRTSEMAAYDPNGGDWTNDAREAIENLFDALSYTLWNGTAEQDFVAHDAPGKDVHKDLKLVFVFEEEGQMVVPVPTKSNIERGEMMAPLRLPADYDMLVSEQSTTEIADRLRQKIQQSHDGSHLKQLDENQIHAIVNTLSEITNEMREEIKGDVGVFNAQLGDYSVRQCAG